MAGEPRPSGACWRGCGGQTVQGRFFVVGHDRRAEAALVRLEYGSVARLLEEHGTGSLGKNLTEAPETRI